MAPFRFIKWIDEGKTVQLFGDGSQSRDFTYVDDIAGGTIKALALKGFQVVNLGSNRPFKLSTFINLIEQNLGKMALRKYFPKNKTDMDATWASVGKAKKLLKWKSQVTLEEGLKRTIAWYKKNKAWASKIRV